MLLGICVECVVLSLWYWVYCRVCVVECVFGCEVGLCAWCVVLGKSVRCGILNVWCWVCSVEYVAGYVCWVCDVECVVLNVWCWVPVLSMWC